jgi:hypothetical protein
LIIPGREIARLLFSNQCPAGSAFSCLRPAPALRMRVSTNTIVPGNATASAWQTCSYRLESDGIVPRPTIRWSCSVGWCLPKPCIMRLWGWFNALVVLSQLPGQHGFFGMAMGSSTSALSALNRLAFASAFSGNASWHEDDSTNSPRSLAVPTSLPRNTRSTHFGLQSHIAKMNCWQGFYNICRYIILFSIDFSRSLWPPAVWSGKKLNVFPCVQTSAKE